jgi:hypothetical protein
MKYFKITCSNGYSGCEEEWYEVAGDTATAKDFDYKDYLFDYSFYDPDNIIFYPDDFDTEEEYDEACAEYQAKINIDIEEIAREEYEANARI